jgi:hypothetical protein
MTARRTAGWHWQLVASGIRDALIAKKSLWNQTPKENTGSKLPVPPRRLFDSNFKQANDFLFLLQQAFSAECFL